jgi:hypothetical protein
MYKLSDIEIRLAVSDYEYKGIWYAIARRGISFRTIYLMFIAKQTFEYLYQH